MKKLFILVSIILLISCDDDNCKYVTKQLVNPENTGIESKTVISQAFSFDEDCIINSFTFKNISSSGDLNWKCYLTQLGTFENDYKDAVTLDSLIDFAIPADPYELTFNIAEDKQLYSTNKYSVVIMDMQYKNNLNWAIGDNYINGNGEEKNDYTFEIEYKVEECE